MPILDVGCGAGNTLIYLANNGFNTLIGIDQFIEPQILILSKKYLKRRYLNLMENIP